MLLSIFCFSVILVAIKLYLKLSCGVCRCSRHLVGKVVIITGANVGIGFEAAKDLAARGARVILACRDPGRGNKAKEDIIKASGNEDVHFRQLDLASFDSVREFADNILKTEKRLDILINNAGAGLGKKKTKDGLLIGMQVNHFGPFLLTNLLLPLLKSSAPSRIINVSSAAHITGSLDFKDINMEKKFSPFGAYANSKLCNVLMSVELSRLLKDTGVTANSLHPGAVQTEIFRNVKNRFAYLSIKWLFKTLYKTAWEGAQTTIHLAVSPEVEGVSGAYFSDCSQKSTSKLAQDKELARRLWEFSENIVNLK